MASILLFFFFRTALLCFNLIEGLLQKKNLSTSGLHAYDSLWTSLVGLHWVCCDCCLCLKRDLKQESLLFVYFILKSWVIGSSVLIFLVVLVSEHVCCRYIRQSCHKILQITNVLKNIYVYFLISTNQVTKWDMIVEYLFLNEKKDVCIYSFIML